MVQVIENLSDGKTANALRGIVHNAQPRLTLSVAGSVDTEKFLSVEGSPLTCRQYRTVIYWILRSKQRWISLP
jgi:hypothetical protein